MPLDIATRPLVLPPPQAGIRVRRDAQYCEDLEADVFSPAADGRHPTIIFIHGGPVPDGAKPKRMRIYGDYGALAAASGFTGVTFNHRFFGDGIARAAADVAALLEFARVQPEVDPERVFYWAFSGGGPFLTFAFDRTDVRAIVAYYAVLDAPEPHARLSPVKRLQSGAQCPPMFIARAGRDSPRLNETVDEFVAVALRRNLELELMTHPDGEHGFDILNDDDRSRAIIRRTFNFIREHAMPSS